MQHRRVVVGDEDESRSRPRKMKACCDSPTLSVRRTILMIATPSILLTVLNDSCDLEFISKMGGTGLVAENLRKQSLYLKFDPLVANEVNSSVNGDTTLTNDVSSLTLNDTLLDSNRG